MEGLLERYFKIKFSKMKGEDLQKLVLYKYEKGEPLTKIFQDFNGFVSSRTIRRWCKMVRETGTINLSHSLDRSRIIRTKEMIQKVKKRMKCKKKECQSEKFPVNWIFLTGPLSES